MTAVARPVKSGDVLLLSTAASVQFRRPITVRVIRPLVDRHTYQGWLWIDAYEIGPKGDAVARRELYIMPAGARWIDTPAPARPQVSARRPVRRTSVEVG
ncbi:hypothetical protein ACLQ24_24965 [Micromonospora sp. DT4]|uniref:hypothetical protein n=1 Tax=Micromonospora sp. DT4 TaxID=3393438 RepID=UPI003CEFBE86